MQARTAVLRTWNRPWLTRTLRLLMGVLLGVETALAAWMTGLVWSVTRDPFLFPSPTRYPISVAGLVAGTSLVLYCALLALVTLASLGKLTALQQRLRGMARLVHLLVAAVASVVYAWTFWDPETAVVGTASLMVLALVWSELLVWTLGPRPYEADTQGRDPAQIEDNAHSDWRTAMALLLLAETALAVLMAIMVWDITSDGALYPRASRYPVSIVGTAASAGLAAYCAELAWRVMRARGRTSDGLVRLARRSTWVHGVVGAVALGVYAWAGPIFVFPHFWTAVSLVPVALLWGHVGARVLGAGTSTASESPG